ncbi:MAG: helix-turn-helix domain-containing protein [Eubacteriales bacterium]|nr:helix-turn-helix domain-containing protein [Eubacteriales bacterium]
MKDDLIIQIGKRVRNRREALGLTREQLAEQTELSVHFFAEIELGRKCMSARSLYKVAKALNLSADFILFGEEGETKKTKLENMLSRLSKKDREHAEIILENYVMAVTDKN